MAVALNGLTYRMRAFLGFSRAIQASLSVAQPFFAALIALHSFPDISHTIVGLVAALAGFFAVFALNDLLDVNMDVARFSHLRSIEGFDIDSAMSRHPLAQRQLAFSSGLAWIVGLALVALIGAYILSPLAAGLFAAAALLEAIYCKLARITSLKFIISGMMVSFGALAGWVAMTDDARPWEMTLIFVWMFAWEIGGRNIVNDFADVEEDVRLGIKTVPLMYGHRVAAGLVFFFLVLTVVASLALQPVSELGLLYLVAACIAGTDMLLRPGVTLLRSPTPQNAMALFNRASFYPPVMLLVLIASICLPQLMPFVFE